jgi:hypothetical protein
MSIMMALEEKEEQWSSKSKGKFFIDLDTKNAFQQIILHPRG